MGSYKRVESKMSPPQPPDARCIGVGLRGGVLRVMKRSLHRVEAIYLMDLDLMCYIGVAACRMGEDFCFKIIFELAEFTKPERHKSEQFDSSSTPQSLKGRNMQRATGSEAARSRTV